MKTASASSLTFTGKFTEEHRRLLRAKRLDLGLSLKQLEDLLGIHCSTIRKWEAGITSQCHPRHVRPVAKFFAGGFDRALQTARHQVQAQTSLPDQIARCLERLGKAYQLLAIQSPQLAAELLEELQTTLRKATDKFRTLCT